MKWKRIFQVALVAGAPFVMAIITVSNTWSECAPDTCHSSSSGNAIWFHGEVRCGVNLVGAGVSVCFTNQADNNWTETCYTDANGRYYLYPNYAGTDSCDFAPSGNYTAVANQCPTAQPCYSQSRTVNWNGTSLQTENFTLTQGPCPSCP